MIGLSPSEVHEILTGVLEQKKDTSAGMQDISDARERRFVPPPFLTYVGTCDYAYVLFLCMSLITSLM